MTHVQHTWCAAVGLAYEGRATGTADCGLALEIGPAVLLERGVRRGADVGRAFSGVRWTRLLLSLPSAVSILVVAAGVELLAGVDAAGVAGFKRGGSLPALEAAGVMEFRCGVTCKDAALLEDAAGRALGGVEASEASTAAAAAAASDEDWPVGDEGSGGLAMKLTSAAEKLLPDEAGISSEAYVCACELAAVGCGEG